MTDETEPETEPDPEAERPEFEETGARMAFPTAVNNQITDAVTQANVKVLSDAPALALGSLYQVAAHAAGIAIANATAQQQASQTINQAVVAAIVQRMVGGA